MPATTETEAVTNFLSDLVKAKQKKSEHDLIETKKRVAFDELAESLTPKEKAKIAEGMKFTLVNKKGKKREKSFSKKGQENSVDTFGATKKGHGLSSEDHNKVYEAMEELVKITRKAIDKILAIKAPDGKPIYDLGNDDEKIREKAQKEFTSLIEYEVFSPLVRQKVLPENFVLDDYSEVQKLLDNTFKQYKATTKESIVQKEEQAVDDQINFDGGRLKADVLKGFGAKASQLKDHLVEKLISSEKLEKLEKRAKFAQQGGKFLIGLAKAGVNIDGYTQEEGLAGTSKNNFSKEMNFLYADDDQDRKNHAIQKRSKLIEDVFAGVQEKLFGVDPAKISIKGDISLTGDQSMGIEPSKINLVKVGEYIDSFLRNVVDSDPFFYTTTSAELLINGIMDGIEIGGVSASMYASDESVKALAKFNAICQSAPDRFDERVAEAIERLATSAAKTEGEKSAASNVKGTFENSFSYYITVSDILKSSTDERGKLIKQKFAEALSQGFVGAAKNSKEFPEASKPFAEAGKAVLDAFNKAFTAERFDEQFGTAETAFEYLFKAGETAIASGLTQEFVRLLLDPKTLLSITAAKAVPPDAFEELEETEEELLEYERALVLIDDGGITLAEQKSIEKLIAEMEKDRQTLELVAKIGTGLSSLGTSTVNIANWATDKLTDVVAGEILGPLKAAQLIMQLSVNAIKAAGRMTLLKTFQQNLARSKTAVSSLSSTIQGFLDNKKEQITFRTIEDSLMAIQAAGAILGSIPEPHAMAIGKTLGLVATAAQEGRKFSEMIYNEAKLDEAWKITKAAMANPRDRALGLAALRVNPTLGMHAIAWAGMEKSPPDPIARMFLDSVGLNEQTLAVSGTESKVRKYLETLLSEDRVMVDSSEINVDWLPENYGLTAEDWFVITSRAQSVAPTKLRSGPEKTVLQCLKQTDKHLLATLPQRIRSKAVSLEMLEQFEKECDALELALKNYRPLTEDGATHEEMETITNKFVEMAKTHSDKLRKLIPADFAQSLISLGRLAKDMALIDLCIDKNGELIKPRKSYREVSLILESESDGLEQIQSRTAELSKDVLIIGEDKYAKIVENAEAKIGLLVSALKKEELLSN